MMGCSSALNNLFVTFYLDLFLNVVRLEGHAFLLGQGVYMVWNCLNDPLFGWLSDRLPLPGGASGVSRRLVLIRWGGLGWSVAFLLVWLPPLGAAAPWARGLHFALSLCLYDGFLTLVELNHSALLAELSSSAGERARLNAASGVCAGLGSLSSFLGYLYWSREPGGLVPFQRMAAALALACAVCFAAASEGLLREQLRGASARAPEKLAAPPSAPRAAPGGAAFARQLLQHRNFWLYNGLYCVQAFDCTFEKNHFALLLDGLAGHAMTAGWQGSVVSASFLLPWIVTVLLAPVVQRRGLYAVVGSILLARIAWCGSSVLFGPASPWFAALFLLTNRVMSESVCRVCPLIVTDLVDEDRFLHRRDSSVSVTASVVGASALLGKCSQSLAPVFGFWALDAKRRARGLEGAERSSVMLLLTSLPLACVLAQWLLWQQFSLQGTYLKKVKAYSSSPKDELDV
jgi:Na+/melibiose symporter-like transporter